MYIKNQLRNQFVNNQPIRQKLTCVVKHHSNDAVLLEQACWLVSNTTHNRDNQVEYGDAGFVEALVDIIERYVACEQLGMLEHACLALCNLTQIHQNQAMCGKAGIDALVKVIVQHHDQPALLKAACCALRNTTLNNQTKCQHNTVRAVVGVVQNYLTGPTDLLIDACAALANMTNEHNFNQFYCGLSRGVEALLDVIRRHMDEPVLLEKACTALCNITSTPCREDNRLKCWDKGGFQTLVDVIKHHMGQSGQSGLVVKKACIALQNIASDRQVVEALVGIVADDFQVRPQCVQ